MESKERIIACLNILKRLPPTQMHKNAAALTTLIPDQAEELYQKIDKPLELGVDQSNGTQFILSEFNRDGDSFRSHLSNQYFPPLDDGILPSEGLRQLEVKANKVFDEYRKLYYEGGFSACYFWDKEDGGFASAWLIRKDVENNKGVEGGSWSSINVIDVRTDGKGKWIYKATSSVVLEMNLTQHGAGAFNITGSLTKSKEDSSTQEGNDLDAFHLYRMGQLVEEVEGQLRSQLDTIYVGKTRDIISQTRYLDGEKQGQQQKMNLAAEFKQKYA